jgi:hypothetical protein
VLRKMFLALLRFRRRHKTKRKVDSRIGINANRLGNQHLRRGQLTAIVLQAEDQRTTKVKGGPVHAGHSKEIRAKTPRFYCVTEGRKQL